MLLVDMNGLAQVYAPAAKRHCLPDQEWVGPAYVLIFTALGGLSVCEGGLSG